MRARTYSRVFALNDYVVDAVLVEELSQEKAGGSASNDSNLCSQGRGPFYSSLAEIGFDDFFIFQHFVWVAVGEGSTIIQHVDTIC